MITKTAMNTAADKPKLIPAAVESRKGFGATVVVVKRGSYPSGVTDTVVCGDVGPAEVVVVVVFVGVVVVAVAVVVVPGVVVLVFPPVAVAVVEEETIGDVVTDDDDVPEPVACDAGEVVEPETLVVVGSPETVVAFGSKDVDVVGPVETVVPGSEVVSEVVPVSEVSEVVPASEVVPVSEVVDVVVVVHETVKLFEVHKTPFPLTSINSIQVIFTGVDEEEEEDSKYKSYQILASAAG